MDMEHVILIDKVQWKITDAIHLTVERNGVKARIIQKENKAKLFMRNVLNGRFRSQVVRLF
jgi:hypothetical protein